MTIFSLERPPAHLAGRGWMPEEYSSTFIRDKRAGHVSTDGICDDGAQYMAKIPVPERILQILGSFFGLFPMGDVLNGHPKFYLVSFGMLLSLINFALMCWSASMTIKGECLINSLYKSFSGVEYKDKCDYVDITFSALLTDLILTSRGSLRGDGTNCAPGVHQSNVK